MVRTAGTSCAACRPSRVSRMAWAPTNPKAPSVANSLPIAQISRSRGALILLPTRCGARERSAQQTSASS